MKTTHDIESILKKPNVVGVIGSKADLDAALQKPDSFQMLEWRVDMAPGDEIAAGLRLLDVPIIVTVRDRSEGGVRPDWRMIDRARRYRKYMHLATFIDIEASTADRMAFKPVFAKARE